MAAWQQLIFLFFPWRQDCPLLSFSGWRYGKMHNFLQKENDVKFADGITQNWRFRSGGDHDDTHQYLKKTIQQIYYQHNSSLQLKGYFKLFTQLLLHGAMQSWSIHPGNKCCWKLWMPSKTKNVNGKLRPLHLELSANKTADKESAAICVRWRKQRISNRWSGKLPVNRNWPCKRGRLALRTPCILKMIPKQHAQSGNKSRSPLRLCVCCNSGIANISDRLRELPPSPFFSPTIWVSAEIVLGVQVFWMENTSITRTWMAMWGYFSATWSKSIKWSLPFLFPRSQWRILRVNFGFGQNQQQLCRMECILAIIRRWSLDIHIHLIFRMMSWHKTFGIIGVR